MYFGLKKRIVLVCTSDYDSIMREIKPDYAWIHLPDLRGTSESFNDCIHFRTVQCRVNISAVC